MRVIHTDNNPIADHLVDEWFNEVKDQEIVYISNSIQFNKLRLEHLKNSIYVESFDLGGEIIIILENGELDYFPDGFFDHNFNIVKEIAKKLKNIVS